MTKKFIKIIEMEKSELENMEIVTGFDDHGSHCCHDLSYRDAGWILGIKG